MKVNNKQDVNQIIIDVLAPAVGRNVGSAVDSIVGTGVGSNVPVMK